MHLDLLSIPQSGGKNVKTFRYVTSQGTGLILRRLLSSFVYFTSPVYLRQYVCVCMGVCVPKKAQNATIMTYRFDTLPSLVWDQLKLSFPEQPHSQHHHPV